MDFNLIIWLAVMVFAGCVWLLMLNTTGRAAAFDESGLVFRPIIGRSKRFRWSQFRASAVHSTGFLPRLLLTRSDATFWTARPSIMLLLDDSSYASDLLFVIRQQFRVQERDA